MLPEKSFHVIVRAVVSIFQSRHTSRLEFFNRIDRFETVSVTPAVDFDPTYPGLHLLPNGQVFNSPTGFADSGTDTFSGTMPEDGRLLTLSSSGGTWTGTW